MHIFFSVFDIIGISKIREFQWKTKVFECLSIFLSFCVRNNISKGFIWVAFHTVSKVQFSAFLSYFPLSLSQQNCREFSENQEFFRFLFKFPLLWSWNKSYIIVLIWQLLVVLLWFHIVHFIYRHSWYILNLANFTEILRFCWILIILAVSIVSLHSFVLNVSRVSQLMRSAASPLCW